MTATPNTPESIEAMQPKDVEKARLKLLEPDIIGYVKNINERLVCAKAFPVEIIYRDGVEPLIMWELTRRFHGWSMTWGTSPERGGGSVTTLEIGRKIHHSPEK